MQGPYPIHMGLECNDTTNRATKEATDMPGKTTLDYLIRTTILPLWRSEAPNGRMAEEILISGVILGKNMK